MFIALSMIQNCCSYHNFKKKYITKEKLKQSSLKLNINVQCIPVHVQPILVKFWLNFRIVSINSCHLPITRWQLSTGNLPLLCLMLLEKIRKVLPAPIIFYTTAKNLWTYYIVCYWVCCCPPSSSVSVLCPCNNFCSSWQISMKF